MARSVNDRLLDETIAHGLYVTRYGTLAMGNPVALLYGEREIGGAIISAGIVAEDI